MKVISKISIILIILISVINFIPNGTPVVFSASADSSSFGALVDKAKPSGSDIVSDSSGVTAIIRHLLGFLEVAAGLMSILVIAFTGFQYIVAADAEMKSEMKKKMLPIIIGLVLVFSASAIVSFILGAVAEKAVA